MTRSEDLSKKRDNILQKLNELKTLFKSLSTRTSTKDISTQTASPFEEKTYAEVAAQTLSPNDITTTPRHPLPHSNGRTYSLSQPSSTDTNRRVTPTTPLMTSDHTTLPSTNTLSQPHRPATSNDPLKLTVSTEQLQGPRHHLKTILNRRKMCFYNHLRTSELVEIYNQNLNMDPPQIPR